MKVRVKEEDDQQLAWVLKAPPKPITFTHGGKRKGAGRKPRDGSRDRNHASRPEHDPRYPVHCSLRVLPDVPRLRRMPVFKAVNKAALVAASREGFRLIHFSIQHNHLHFIVEAESKAALSSGMQSLAIAAAKAINKALGRTGKVFAHRYFPRAIKSPTQARNVLHYVLNNWRRHREDETSGIDARTAPLDPYSSAVMFDGWKEWREMRGRLPHYLERSAVQAPQTWLLYDGWRLAKRPISMFGRPTNAEAP